MKYIFNRSILLLYFFILISNSFSQCEMKIIDQFFLRSMNENKIPGWEEKSFVGRTSYAIVEQDGNSALHARAASAFFILLLLETFFPLFKGWKNRARHISRNFSIVVVNNLVFFALLSFATAFIFRTVEKHQFGIFNFSSLPMVLRIALIVIVFDLWMYFWHRWVHTSAFLWRFHRMHHSDPNRDASTALRFHPGEIVFSTILRWGIFLILGMTPYDVLIYETIMLPVFFSITATFSCQKSWIKFCASSLSRRGCTGCIIPIFSKRPIPITAPSFPGGAGYSARFDCAVTRKKSATASMKLQRQTGKRSGGC